MFIDGGHLVMERKYPYLEAWSTWLRTGSHSCWCWCYFYFIYTIVHTQGHNYACSLCLKVRALIKFTMQWTSHYHHIYEVLGNHLTLVKEHANLSLCWICRFLDLKWSRTSFPSLFCIQKIICAWHFAYELLTYGLDMYMHAGKSMAIQRFKMFVNRKNDIR